MDTLRVAPAVEVAGVAGIPPGTGSVLCGVERVQDAVEAFSVESGFVPRSIRDSGKGGPPSGKVQYDIQGV